MSPSPQPEPDVDQPDQTPEDNDPQNKDMSLRDDDPNLGYDFEVKEQDRWLPIANGECDCNNTFSVTSLVRPACPGVLWPSCVTRALAPLS